MNCSVRVVKSYDDGRNALAVVHFQLPNDIQIYCRLSHNVCTLGGEIVDEMSVITL